MKKARPSPSPRRKESDVAQAIGGQPENDHDAREAGLNSATSANGGEKPPKAAPRHAKAPAKSDKAR